MGRPQRSDANPKDPHSIVEHLGANQRILDGQVEFGHPGNPISDASTALAGTTHNGTLMNMAGSWVELAVSALNTNTTCTHNLELAIPSASQPNCRWLVWGWQHDGTGAGATTQVNALYVDGTVGANSIQLKFYATTLTVGAGNKLRVTLYFIPAVRGIAQ